jgi:hypothetical protein
MKNTAKAGAAAENFPPLTPELKEAIQQRVVRTMIDIKQSWRSCRVAKCRRLRRCAGARFSCVKKAKPMTPAEDARMKARLRHDLNRRLAELGQPKA